MRRSRGSDARCTRWPACRWEPRASRCRRSLGCRRSPGQRRSSFAYVGAHLSGMPLNHELRTLGARFLRAVRRGRLCAIRPAGRPAAQTGTRPGGGGARSGHRDRGLGALPRSLRALCRGHPRAAEDRDAQACRWHDAKGFLAETMALKEDARTCRPLAAGAPLWPARRNRDTIDLGPVPLPPVVGQGAEPPGMASPHVDLDQPPSRHPLRL